MIELEIVAFAGDDAAIEFFLFEQFGGVFQLELSGEALGCFAFGELVSAD